MLLYCHTATPYVNAEREKAYCHPAIHPIVMRLGDQIIRLRKQKQWSMNELARRSGLNPPTLQKIEKGKSDDPSVSLVAKIARALGVPVEVLLEGDERVGSIHADLSSGDSILLEIAIVGTAAENRTDEIFAAHDFVATALRAAGAHVWDQVQLPIPEGLAKRPAASVGGTESHSNAQVPEGPVAAALRQVQHQLDQIAADAVKTTERLAALEAREPKPKRTGQRAS